MSLHINNMVTDKQVAILTKYDYCGTFNLTIEEAAKIIDELFEEQRMHKDDYQPDYFNEKEI